MTATPAKPAKPDRFTAEAAARTAGRTPGRGAPPPALRDGGPRHPPAKTTTATPGTHAF
ncbi:MAG: hypothetical protein LBC18_05795 [Opitutaceae bacterium]|nr:hypothetical protein [Opitutaceae bacterium]